MSDIAVLTVSISREPDFDTLQVHAGHSPDLTTNARAPPIYASVGFVFNDSAVSDIMILGAYPKFTIDVCSTGLICLV